MILDEPQLLGLATVAFLALFVMLIVLRRQPRALWFFSLVLLVAVLGYLSTTTVPTWLARTIFGQPA